MFSVLAVLLICSAYGNIKVTTEWQVWDKDEPLPEGLHYRINLENGLKEVKLLETKDNKGHQVANIEQLDTDKTDQGDKLELTEQQKASMAKINDYLNNLKSEREKEDFEGVEVTPDFDVMKNLTEIVAQSHNYVIVESALNELEYLLHQFDNGNDFEQLNGFETVLKIIDDQMDNNLVKSAARVITTATQANPKARISVHKINGVARLIQGIGVFSETDTQKSLLVSLSALIRDFPAAQTDFINLKGPEKLLRLTDHILDVKILTLFSDLLQERDNLPQIPKTEHEEKLVKAYSMANLNDSQLGICGFIQKIETFDSHNLNIAAVNLINRLKCFHPAIHDKLIILQSRYDILCGEDIADGESERDSYFCEIRSNIGDVLEQLPLIHNEL